MAEDEPKKEDEPKGDEKEMVSKADLDAALAKNKTLESELEDVKMEVLTPEYQNYLDKIEKGEDDDKGKPKDDASDTTISDDAFEKMSKKELFDAAVKKAEENIKGEVNKEKETAQQREDAKQKALIAKFAKEHEDYETYRPIMHGLSTAPENADLTLQQLYDKAKEHVGKIHKVPTKEEQAEIDKAQNEKPETDAESLERTKDQSNEDIAKDAMADLKKQGMSFDNVSG